MGKHKGCISGTAFMKMSFVRKTFFFFNFLWVYPLLYIFNLNYSQIPFADCSNHDGVSEAVVLNDELKQVSEVHFLFFFFFCSILVYKWSPWYESSFAVWEYCSLGFIPYSLTIFCFVIWERMVKKSTKKSSYRFCFYCFQMPIPSFSQIVFIFSNPFTQVIAYRNYAPDEEVRLSNNLISLTLIFFPIEINSRFSISEIE